MGSGDGWCGGKMETTILEQQLNLKKEKKRNKPLIHRVHNLVEELCWVGKKPIPKV